MQNISTREIELFTLYGSATSEAMLDYPCHYFQIPNCKGLIAYRVESKCAVIFGDPLCPFDELPRLLQAFHQYCLDAHLRIIYIAVSEKFAKLAKEYCHISMEICEEYIFDPQNDLLSQSHRLHHRMDKAIKQGLSFHEYFSHDENIEKSLLNIGNQWQKTKKGPGLYLGHLNFFDTRQGKRWFYVKDGKNIVSMAMLSQLSAQNGWLLKFFFTLPNAFPETSEFLMISLLTTLKKENCSYLTKGVVPLDSIGEIKGLGYSYSLLLNSIFKTISAIFKFKKRKQYWQRYHPIKAPSYILFSHSRIGFNEAMALCKVIRM